MSNILRRLQKLEAQITDRSGYVPHSEAWFRHWSERYGRYLSTGDDEFIKGMTLDFVDELLARAREDQQKTATVAT